jgi:hypothetical protein
MGDGHVRGYLTDKHPDSAAKKTKKHPDSSAEKVTNNHTDRSAVEK